MRYAKVLFVFCCLASCTPSETAEDVQQKASELLTRFSEEQAPLQQTLQHAHYNMLQQQDSSSRFAYVAAQQALETWEVAFVQQPEFTELLRKREQLTLAQREQVLYLAEKGKSRAAVPNRAYYWQQTFEHLRAEHRILALGKTFRQQDADSLSHVLANPSLRMNVWQASQLPADTVYVLAERVREALQYIFPPNYGSDFFTYSVLRWGLAPSELMSLSDTLTAALAPTVKVLSAHYRKQLAQTFRVPEPELLPIYWLPDGQGQQWNYHEVPEPTRTLLSNLTEDETQQNIRTYFEAIGLKTSRLDSLLATRAGYASSPMNVFPSNVASQSFARSIRLLLTHAARNPDMPLALRGEQHPFFLPMVSALFARKPLEAGFWQMLEKLPPADAASTSPIELLHLAYADVMYCAYVAGVVLPVQQAFYVQKFTPALANATYWDRMRTVLGIAPPYSRTGELPPLPAHVLLYPLAHAQEMIGILLANQWAQQYGVGERTAEPAATLYGIALYNSAYYGVRANTSPLALLREGTPARDFAKPFAILPTLLSDSLTHPLQNYALFPALRTPPLPRNPAQSKE